MNDRQRLITATFIVAFFVAAFFYVPWQRDDANGIRYAPFYRNPITLNSTLSGPDRFVYVKGSRFYSLYFLQLIGIAGTGRMLFWLARTKD
ncbi:MAG: hypothetical protein HKN37_08250 [Rhodothermales bacterium]|nr:hypothetical protein [Rhodothermales bacterium]